MGFRIAVPSSHCTRHERSTRPSAANVPPAQPLVLSAAGFQVQSRVTRDGGVPAVAAVSIRGRRVAAATVTLCALAGAAHARAPRATTSTGDAPSPQLPLDRPRHGRRHRPARQHQRQQRPGRQHDALQTTSRSPSASPGSSARMRTSESALSSVVLRSAGAGLAPSSVAFMLGSRLRRPPGRPAACAAGCCAGGATGASELVARTAPLASAGWAPGAAARPPGAGSGVTAGAWGAASGCGSAAGGRGSRGSEHDEREPDGEQLHPPWSAGSGPPNVVPAKCVVNVALRHHPEADALGGGAVAGRVARPQQRLERPRPQPPRADPGAEAPLVRARSARLRELVPPSGSGPCPCV